MRSYSRMLAVVLGVGGLFASGRALASDVESGPPVGEKPPALKAEAVTGDHAGKLVEFTSDRATKPTIYLFVPAEKFTRPIARFMKKLDTELKEVNKDAAIVAVWITADTEATKSYLPKAQQSLSFSLTALGYVTSEPASWGINGDAHVTAVVVREGKTASRFGYVSANETLVGDVLKPLK